MRRRPLSIPIATMQQDPTVTPTIGHLIAGQILADSARTQPVFDPATGLSRTSVALASKATVLAAIASAHAAFPAWRNTTGLKRARVISRLQGGPGEKDGRN